MTSTGKFCLLSLMSSRKTNFKGLVFFSPLEQTFCPFRAQITSFSPIEMILGALESSWQVFSDVKIFLWLARVPRARDFFEYQGVQQKMSKNGVFSLRPPKLQFMACKHYVGQIFKIKSF